MKIIFSLFFYHLCLIFLGIYIFCKNYGINECKSVWLSVLLAGLIGGCTYCIKGLYTQYCVKKEWDNRWVVWHIIRPFISTICGGVSLLFIKAGLLLFAVSNAEIQKLLWDLCSCFYCRFKC